MAKILNVGRTTLYEWIKVYEGGEIKEAIEQRRTRVITSSFLF